MTLKSRGSSHTQKIIHSFTLGKTLVITQKKGGSLVQDIILRNEGKAYRSETLNLDWITSNSNEAKKAFDSMSDNQKSILSGLGKCYLFVNITIDDISPDGSDHKYYFELEEDITDKITYRYKSDGSIFTFSPSTGDLIAINADVVLKYEERSVTDDEFELPEICLEMLRNEGAVDERSEAMRTSSSHTSRYYERSLDNVIAKASSADANSGQHRKLDSDIDMWLNLRLPGTKFCGKGNDYNDIGNVQISPTVGSTLSCSDPPMLTSSCAVTLDATSRITSDAYDVPTIDTLQAYNPSGPWCVADNGDPELTAIDKACRQHDFCPYSNGNSRMSCACDKTLRDNIHRVQNTYGVSLATTIILSVFANANFAWVCNNLERECGDTYWYGGCKWNKWFWNYQSLDKYVPYYCSPSDYTCTSSGDEDGRLWGVVGHYETNVCPA